MAKKKDNYDVLLSLIDGLTEPEMKFLEGQLNIAAAARNLRSQMNSDDAFFEKVGRKSLGSKARLRFLKGTHKYTLSDIASIEAGRCGFLLGYYDELARKQAKILHIIPVDILNDKD